MQFEQLAVIKWKSGLMEVERFVSNFPITLDDVIKHFELNGADREHYSVTLVDTLSTIKLI